MENIKSQETKSRPISISIICILLLLGSISFLLIVIFPSYSKTLYPGYTYSLANKIWIFFSGIFGILCSIFLWKMKKIAGIATIGFAIMGTLSGLLFWGKFSSSDLLGLVFMIFIIIHFKKMT